MLSAPEEYAEDAADYHRIIQAYHPGTPKTLLELGSGGGNNASFMKKHYAITLCDCSEHMLAVSRKRNHECEHLQGDMRTLRLNRQFDVVFIQDAIGYMTTAKDLKAAMQTAFVHCNPGGIALFVPDYTRETFRPATYHGGHDGRNASMRFLQWDHDPIPDDGQYQIDFAYLFRSSGSLRPEVIGETHICGLFKRKDWLKWIRATGFKANSETIETDQLEPGLYRVFIGRKPA
ncbi:MAG: class I SAM-dependent DNA methyltransferase [Kiritimatiellia bacterium]